VKHILTQCRIFDKERRLGIPNIQPPRWSTQPGPQQYTQDHTIPQTNKSYKQIVNYNVLLYPMAIDAADNSLIKNK